MMEHSLKHAANTKQISRCITLLIVLNLLFLTIRLADNLVEKNVVATALRTGFASGSMTTTLYPDNMLAGLDQYSDCVTAQIAVIGDPDPIRDAIAPHIMSDEQVLTGDQTVNRERCTELLSYVTGHSSTKPEATYTRFWHGAASVLAVALQILPVDGYRALLLNLTLGLIALTAVLAARARSGLLLSIAPILGLSFLFDGQFGFGQLFSYGPAQIALWLLSAITVALRNRIRSNDLALLAVLSGALEAFLDQLISPPLVAMVFLIVLQCTWLHRARAQTVRQSITVMLSIYAAWSLGFIGTYLIKLVGSMIVLGWGPLHDMVSQLMFRTGTVDPLMQLNMQDHWSRFHVVAIDILALIKATGHLGVTGSRTTIQGNVAIALFGLSGWILACIELVRATGQNRSKFIVVGIPYIAASFFFLLWIFALPEHTLRHAFFMVRPVIVWLAGGWGWLIAHRAWNLELIDGLSVLQKNSTASETSTEIDRLDAFDKID